MATEHPQRGSLMLGAVALIVVVALLGSVVTYLFAGSLRANADQAASHQALYLAESGLQRGVREWALDPPNYTGEGPLALGAGSFTITTDDFDAGGAPLPPGQKRIISSATVAAAGGAVVRTLDLIAALSGGGFTDTFPNLGNWPAPSVAVDSACPGTGGPVVLANQGTVAHDPTQDAGSGNGSFKAQVVAGKAGERLAGYRQYTLAAPIPGNSSITLDLWYQTVRGKPKPDAMMMAVDLVASDGTSYRVWANCQVKSTNWSAAGPLAWTVPAGKTIDRVRLAYDLWNGVGGGGTPASSSVYFDELILTLPGGLASVVSW